MIAPTNLILTKITGGIRLNWACSGAHETEIYVSVDSVAYSLLDTVTEGVVTYDDINDYVTHTVKYKLRAKGADTTSGFSNTVNDILEFVFTSTGDGSGLGVFNLMPSVETTMTIDGTGRFYDDLAGTTNERDSQVLTADALNRVYIKVPSGIATVRVKNIITQWGDNFRGSAELDDGWDTYVYGDHSSLNCPSVSIDVATMTRNTSINVFGLNTIHGDLSGNSIMTYMEIADGTPNHTTPGHGGATCGGDISLMPLDTFDVWDDTHFTGTCESAGMKVIWCNGLNEVTFNISAMPLLKTLIELAAGSCMVIGDISLCPDIAFVQTYHCAGLTGSMDGLTNLQFNQMWQDSNVTITRFVNMTKLDYFRIEGRSYSSSIVNQLLADLWANKDTAGRNYNFRQIYLSGTPTGQGISDKTNLQAYRTPNNDPTKDLWTIVTL